MNLPEVVPNVVHAEPHVEVEEVDEDEEEEDEDDEEDQNDWITLDNIQDHISGVVNAD